MDFTLKEAVMNAKVSLLAVLVSASLATAAGSVEAKGCVKGAAVGGVAGHVAGGHGVLGAAAGCAIGHHQATKAARRSATANGRTATPMDAGSTTTPAATDTGGTPTTSSR